MAEGPIARTGAGDIRGRVTGVGEEYLGIPYAVAERFAAPQPPPPAPGVRDALSPGPAAPQPARAAAAFTHGELPVTDERHCLTLNVFTPARAGVRPVMVWIHGGGFAIGHGSSSIYHGARLAAAADVVVVTLNYRLGSLGWLAHPALAADPRGAAANWGLLDQLQALRWVAANIAAFGGAPGSAHRPGTGDAAPRRGAGGTGSSISVGPPMPVPPIRRSIPAPRRLTSSAPRR